MRRVDTTASIYYALQAVAVAAWWASMAISPGIREYFEFGDSPSILNSFLLPDLAFLVPASIVTAALCSTNHAYKGIAAWFTTGVLTYPTVFTLAYALETDSGWPGVMLMIPATLWSGNFAVGVSALAENMFRQTRDGSGRWMFTKTLVQIVVVWSVILGLFPYLIVWVEQRLGIPQLEFAFQTPVTIVLFVLVSIPGVWSAHVMSMEGKGTPLPFDHASSLVVSGPYRYIRNPMAFSGIGQGLTVALLWGSPLVAAYALTGSLIWQFIFRPWEEADLEKRFGDPYRKYRSAVRCWIPGRGFDA